MILKEKAKAVVQAASSGDLDAAIKALAQELDDIDQLARDHELTIDAARNNYCLHDDIQINDDPIISEANEGVWVSAWVWVPIEGD